MLDTPKYGWCHLQIGDWQDRCSYLNDVPVLLLDALTAALKRGTHLAAVSLDAEGYEYIVVFDGWNNIVHIITETENAYSLNSIEARLPALAEELITDVEARLPDWAVWLPGMEEAEYRERGKLLRGKLTLLRTVLDAAGGS